jgi:hypothetical protein
MRGYAICFPEPYRAVLVEREVSPDDLGPGQALVRGVFSIISAGTDRSAGCALGVCFQWTCLIQSIMPAIVQSAR